MIRKTLFTAAFTVLAFASGTETEASFCDLHVANISVTKETNEWDLFVEALIQVESGGDSTAVGKGDCAGILQITPVFVREANRLLGSEKYTPDDRFDKTKSLEIFNTVQRFHNPQKDIDRAIAIHNPKAPERYKNDIKRKIK